MESNSAQEVILVDQSCRIIIRESLGKVKSDDLKKYFRYLTRIEKMSLDFCVKCRENPKNVISCFSLAFDKTDDGVLLFKHFNEIAAKFPQPVSTAVEQLCALMPKWW